MTSPFGAAARAQFSLASDGVFLNHGSFGAVPRSVQAAQSEWRAVMERQPDVFFRRTMKPGIRAACEVLGPVLGVPGEELALVENATTAISTVLQRMAFQPGDEILITDTTYNAVRLAAADECRRTGAILRTAELPFPYTDDDDAVARALAAAGPRTRLAVLDHIVSPTGFVLPVARMARALKDRNIRVLIDGAHGPGHVALKLPQLNADWVTGNLHKWLYMPRGSAYLWTASDVRDITLPLNISHDAGLGFPRAFDYTGTRDATAWLCMPDALIFMEDYGRDRIMAYNSGLVRMGAMLFQRMGAAPPAGEAQFAAMWSLHLPTRRPAEPQHATQLLNEMWDRHRVQIAASAVHGRLLLRLSAQIYCTLEDFARAAEALDMMGWPGRT